MKSKVVLLLALMMAMITTVLFFQYMKKFETATTVTTPNKVEVVIALEQIDKNERITAEKLKLVLLDEHTIQPQAIKTIDEVVGQIATSTIIKDEQILSHRIVSEKSETIYVSRKVKENHRAVSIGVDINQSVTNLIEPEDIVDVILTKTKKVGEVEQKTSDFILEKVRVLAVGRKMVNPEDTEEPYVEYSSVTFELKPEDALILLRSYEEGKIHLILRQRPAEQIEEMLESDQG
jgi:pilus assembly protein CpaB